MNLDTLRDKLNRALDRETADSLNEWINNKRDINNLTNKVNFMTDEQIARVQLVCVLDNVQSIIHELALGEMDELIDELTHVYERYNVYVQSRNGDQH
jgi:hypothetical protein